MKMVSNGIDSKFIENCIPIASDLCSFSKDICIDKYQNTIVIMKLHDIISDIYLIFNLNSELNHIGKPWKIITAISFNIQSQTLIVKSYKDIKNYIKSINLTFDQLVVRQKDGSRKLTIPINLCELCGFCILSSAGFMNYKITLTIYYNSIKFPNITRTDRNEILNYNICGQYIPKELFSKEIFNILSNPKDIYNFATHSKEMYDLFTDNEMENIIQEYNNYIKSNYKLSISVCGQFIDTYERRHLAQLCGSLTEMSNATPVYHRNYNNNHIILSNDKYKKLFDNCYNYIDLVIKTMENNI